MEYITARDSGAVIVARRSGTIDYVDSQRIVVRVESETEDNLGKEMGADIYPMTKFKRSNQNTCITQKPIVRVGPEGAQGAGARRRPVHRAGRARARPERARRVHAVARLQLRGRDSRLRADGEGRLLHVDPHRGVRDRGARHQARARGDHARHPERVGELPAATSTRAASSASAPTSSRATSWSARSRRRARRSSRRKRSCSARSSARRPATSATPRSICPPGIEGIIVGVQDLLPQGHREGRPRRRRSSRKSST